jgi:hypothetical protein
MGFDWDTESVALPVADWFDESEQKATLQDATRPTVERVRAARELAWAKRATKEDVIAVARLRLGPIDILHAPGELFVEYQFAAQMMRPESFVCTAAYGDYWPGYIGTAEAYAEGGYETGMESRASRVNARAEPNLLAVFRKLLE